jgi:hypothetical protein
MLGDEPFTFADFSGVAPPTTAGPGTITFPSAGFFPSRSRAPMRQGALIHVATRTITVNSPPESQITSPQADLTVYAGTGVHFSGRNVIPITSH